MHVRTRFAPSPTGYMHIGNLRSALYAYLFARKYKGDFILRIEDTDRDRFIEGATDIIYSTLKDVGMVWDEGPDIGGDYGPYIQSERKGIYKIYALQLIENGSAYYCFCSKEELDARRAAAEKAGDTYKYDKHCLHMDKDEVQRKLDANEPYVIRQNIPQSGTTSFHDELLGTITVENSTLDDNVLIKADGMPTYNFANVVDDHLMAITHVMRGMEYLSSAPKYDLLYEGFGWDIPSYIHMPPVMRDAKKKLSKRDGDASYEDFIKKGYLKEAIINYIALLGWNPGTEQEIFTLDELIEAFSIEGMSKSPAIFDIAKLTWLNFEYVRALSPEQYRAHALSWYKKAGLEGYDYDILDAILQPRTEYFAQLPEKVAFLTSLPEYDAALFTNKKSKTDSTISKQILEHVLPLMRSLPEWTQTALHDCLMGYAEQTQRKHGTVLWPVRIALSGQAVTPGGAMEIAVLLDRDESLRRLELGLAKLS